MSWNFLAAEVDVTPAIDSAWHDVDCSALIPATATGVILHIISPSASITAGAARMNGSTDLSSTRATTGGISLVHSHQCSVVGVSGRIFEYLGSAVVPTQKIWVLGYTEDETVMVTNALYVSNAGTGYQDFDVSAQIPVADNAIAAIVCVDSIGPCTCRANGSTDDRQPSVNVQMRFTVSLDATQIVEAYKAAAGNRLIIYGWVKRGFVGLINATNVSIAAENVWTDIAATPASATGVYYITYFTGGANFWDDGFRPKGGIGQIEGQRISNNAIVATGTGNIVQGYRTDNQVTFWLAGYSEEVPPVFADIPRVDELPWTPPTNAADPTGITLTSYFAPFERKLEVGPLPALRLLRR